MSLKDNPEVEKRKIQLKTKIFHQDRMREKDILPTVQDIFKCSDDILNGRHACNVQPTDRKAGSSTCKKVPCPTRGEGERRDLKIN